MNTAAATYAELQTRLRAAEAALRMNRAQGRPTGKNYRHIHAILRDMQTHRTASRA